MNDATIGIVKPELVAQKVAGIRNYEQPAILKQVSSDPRLLELLWFLQFESMQPGGLRSFVESMIQKLPSRFGTATMRSSPDCAFTLEEKLRIRAELPTRLTESPDMPIGGDYTLDLLNSISGDDSSAMEVQDRREAEKALKSWTPASLRNHCFEAARKRLPDFYSELCTHPAKGFSIKEVPWGVPDCWFIDDPVAAALEMMELKANQVSSRLAMTAVAKKVFDALDYAIQERTMVRVEGDSRFGKTESVRTWCEMRPGRARLVSVPSSNSLTDLHRRIAEALGMDVSYGSRGQRLKERVEYVLKHSKMFIILDEAAFLVPQNYTAATAPARLNWVRTEIVDRGLPVAVVVTPQSFLPAVDRFIKKTGYAFEQFFGRNYRTVRLPNELEEADMISVARIHFPEMGEDYLALIADMARISENYLQAVEAIAKLARYIARREGHRRISVSDIEAAASEVIPRLGAQSAAEEGDSPRHTARQLARGGTVGQMQGDLKGVARAVKPSRNATSAVILQSRSLRGSGPDSEVSPELVSVGV